MQKKEKKRPVKTKTKRIRLKKSVLVKESKAGEVLVLNPANDTFLGASQDSARIITILFENWRRGLPLEDIQARLAERSPKFRKYKFQREGLLEVLQQLRNLELIEDNH